MFIPQITNNDTNYIYTYISHYSQYTCTSHSHHKYPHKIWQI